MIPTPRRPTPADLDAAVERVEAAARRVTTTLIAFAVIGVVDLAGLLVVLCWGGVR